jgi:hypothetical protein
MIGDWALPHKPSPLQLGFISAAPVAEAVEAEQML